MKRVLLVIAAVIGLLVAFNVVCRFIPSYTEYQGQQIRLTRYYLDYEDYKDDPDNIDPSENARVQQLISEAPIARSFDSREDLIHALFEIKFPGYGAAGLGDGRQGENSITGLSLEIPRADKSRYLAFQCKAGKYLLLDDFVESDMPLLMYIHQDGANLTYTSDRGQRRLVRPAKYPLQ